MHGPEVTRTLRWLPLLTALASLLIFTVSPFLGHRVANLFRVHFSMTRSVYSPCRRQSCVSGCFWLWFRPLLCCFLCFVAGETPIWPFGFAVRCLLFAFYLPASLIVGIEPQSEIAKLLQALRSSPLVKGSGPLCLCLCLFVKNVNPSTPLVYPNQRFRYLTTPDANTYCGCGPAVTYFSAMSK